MMWNNPIRLLIVDDRLPAREGLRALLSVIGDSDEQHQYPPILVVGEACDGTQAIKMVQELHPDVVLMDVRMPGLSGLETTRLLRESWPDIQIILMSFYGVHRVEALETGANSFLLKGCSPEELLDTILMAKFGKRPRHSGCLEECTLAGKTTKEKTYGK
jgi:DNA-binding NarL/FixJ family response regulator